MGTNISSLVILLVVIPITIVGYKVVKRALHAT
jgi:hypothetical protein